MGKYRKKPVVIEVFKWTGDRTQIEDPSWMVEAIKNNTVFFKGNLTEDVNLCIKTLEGTMTADRGDYIIKGINGELYPCKPDIFEKTYEPVIDVSAHETIVEKTVEAINNINKLNN